jgi:hypothetical protein
LKSLILQKFLNFFLSFAVLCLALLLGSASVAESIPTISLPDQVVLLHTLNESYRGLFSDPAENIENVFQRRFGNSGYRLKVIAKAKGIDVQRELLNPENLAVFFVGHAGGGQSSSSSGIASSSLIVDVDQRDIGPLFSHVHPGLRVLSVVGCTSEKILDQYQKAHLYPPTLQVIAFQDLVDPQFHRMPSPKKNGLDRAISQAYSNLSEDLSYQQAFGDQDYCSQRYPRRWKEDPFSVHCRQRAMEMRPVLRKKMEAVPTWSDEKSVEVAHLKVIRHRQKNSMKMPPALFFMGGVYLGFFPGGDLPMESMTLTITARDAERMGSNKVIEVDSGDILIPRKESVDMGYFEIHPSFPGQYNVVRSFDGSFLGTTRNVYTFKP